MDIKQGDQPASPRKFQHFARRQARYPAYATACQNNVRAPSTDVYRSSITGSNLHHDTKQPHREQLKHSYPADNPPTTPQAVADTPPLHCSEQKGYPFRNWSYGSRTHPAPLPPQFLQLFVTFPLQYPGMIIVQNRQAPWIFRQFNKTPNFMTCTFLYDILLKGIGRLKTNKQTRKTCQPWSQTRQRGHNESEVCRKQKNRGSKKITNESQGSVRRSQKTRLEARRKLRRVQSSLDKWPLGVVWPCGQLTRAAKYHMHTCQEFNWSLTAKFA